jgi:hypothetical protein
MKRKSTLFLLLTTLLLIAFLVPACQKKFELDDQALLQLQCNASDAESIIEGIGETSETTVEPTETEPTDPTEPTETEETEVTDSPAVTEVSVTETTKVTTKETTKKTTAPTADPSTRVAPVVKAVAGANSVTVSWNKITNPDLVGYKVVASYGCSTPKYPDNGYYAWITDANTTSCTIENGEGYGDDIGCFSGGTQYYFSVTAIYGDDWQKIAGNAVRVTMPGEPASTEPVGTHPASSLATPVIDGTSVSFSWSKSTDTTGFQYYKLVGSQEDTTPTYPENGYLAVISDPDSTGRTESLGSGTWYIGITTVYEECGTYYYSYSNVQTIVIP